VLSDCDVVGSNFLGDPRYGEGHVSLDEDSEHGYRDLGVQDIIGDLRGGLSHS